MKAFTRNPHRGAIAAMLCAPLALYACSGGSSTLTMDAGNDALASGEVSMPEVEASDSAASRPTDASREIDDTTDIGVDGPAPTEEANAAETDVVGVADAPACGSIDQACADGGAMAYACMDWSTAQHAAAWCSRFPNYRVGIAAHCDGYDVVAIAGVDTSTVYYFDPDTGALLGVEGRTAVLRPRCIAGTAPGIPLTDCFEAGTFTQATCLSDGAVKD